MIEQPSVPEENAHTLAEEQPAAAPRTRSGIPMRFWLVGGICAIIAAMVLGAGAGGWWIATSTIVATQGNDDAGPAAESAANISDLLSLEMPDVRGLDRATAEQVLADSGVPLTAISVHDTPSVITPGLIVEQDPAFGASSFPKVELGIAVPVTMPKLQGETKDAAVDVLSGFGASVELTYQYSKEAVPGSVISSTPKPGKPLDTTAVLAIATSGSTLSLGELDPIRGTCDGGADGPIDGVSYATVLACAGDDGVAGTTTWRLSKTTDRVTATIGISDDAEPGTQASFKILVDGEVVSSGVVAFGAPETIDLSCSGAIQLSLRIKSKSATEGDVVLGDPLLYGSDEALTRLSEWS